MVYPRLHSWRLSEQETKCFWVIPAVSMFTKPLSTVGLRHFTLTSSHPQRPELWPSEPCYTEACLLPLDCLFLNANQNPCNLCPSIFTSCGCYNKEPQTGWFKITEMYRLIVQEARSPKTRCWWGHAPSKSFLGSSFGVFLAIFGILWVTDA